MKLLIVSLYLCSSLMLWAQDTIVPKGASWRYQYGNSNLAPDWYHNPDVSSTWKMTVSPVEFERFNQLNNVHDSIVNEEGNLTSYFFTSFNLTTRPGSLAYEIRYRVDDGMVLFINGMEVHRANIGRGDIDLVTGAHDDVDQTEELDHHTAIISPEYLKKGINTIAVAVYQWKEKETDLIFDIELIGHNDVKIIPQLLQHLDDESITLGRRLEEMMLIEEVNEANNKTDICLESNRYHILVKNIFLSLFLLAFIFSLVLLYFYRRTLKNDNQLVNENKSMRQEIMNTSISNIRSQHFLEELGEKIQDSIKTQSFSQLRNISKKIEEKISSSEEWEQFEFHFNVINSGFIDRLKKDYPVLTATELRHCIFIKSLLPAKEVALLMGVELRTVQTTWYRIKKKMELPSNMDLKTFLINY